MSVNNISPKTLFGGTWERLKSRFLIGTDDDIYASGDTGGEATHTLTIDEMPTHSHNLKYRDKIIFTSSAGNHTYETRSDAENDGIALNAITSTGGGQAHNNMPPYLAVYMWKRTG